MARGTLRIYLGAAPGVGKTYAMLGEGNRRAQRGTDVVVGVVETHGRAKTAEMLRGLEVLSRRTSAYRGSKFTDLDLDAALARAPEVILVDELAHTNVPGSRHAKRWEDIDELLAAGIDVVSTVNIQHLESLNDVVEGITGIIQRERVPDAWVRRADQIELVDMSPEALRRRLAHGNVYQPDKVDAALANYFRPGNLAALRELALLWMADRVEEYLDNYRTDQGISRPWEVRERVVVALTGRAGGDAVIRRAARMAQRRHGTLLGVHVTGADGLAARKADQLNQQRRLLAEMGGTYHEVVGDDVAAAIADFVRGEGATQVVLGATGRSLWSQLLSGSVTSDAIRRLPGIDVHVLSPVRAGKQSENELIEQPVLRRLFRHLVPGSTHRVALACLLGLSGLPLMLGLMYQFRETHLGVASVALTMLVFVVAVAGLGGLLIGFLFAVVAALSLNWFFVPPYGTLDIAEGENVVVLVVFLLVAGVVSALTDGSARRTRSALRARAEAEALARSAAVLAGPGDSVEDMLHQICLALHLRGASLLRRNGDDWEIVASDGDLVPTSPDEGTSVRLDDGETSMLVLAGQRVHAGSRGVLRAFADQLHLALNKSELEVEAKEAARLAESEALRTSLLRSVSHDLRTPLSSIKASATSLLQSDVQWSDEERNAFLVTIDQSCDRLNRVVGNLLDMSRLQAGAVELRLEDVFLEDVVAATLSNVPDSATVQVDVPETIPAVIADPALLERALANLVSNALAWTAAAQPVRLHAGQVGDRVHLQVIDQGPGVPTSDRTSVFEPFQRRGDRSNDTGVGLGLAIARGFVAAMGGELSLDDTPGGGLTAVIDLAVVDRHDGAAAGPSSAYRKVTR